MIIGSDKVWMFSADLVLMKGGTCLADWQTVRNQFRLPGFYDSTFGQIWLRYLLPALGFLQWQVLPFLLLLKYFFFRFLPAVELSPVDPRLAHRDRGWHVRSLQFDIILGALTLFVVMCWFWRISWFCWAILTFLSKSEFEMYGFRLGMVGAVFRRFSSWRGGGLHRL